jgi:hypothetical protein
LQHELGDDAMELAALVPEAFLAGAKSTEVFDSLWDCIVVELEVDAADFGWQTWLSAGTSTSENAAENQQHQQQRSR